MTTSERRVGARGVAIVATFALALTIWPSASWALSLGEARVLSALDAPLEAEIDIIDASADELAALVVEVPSRDVFVRYGVARPAYLETARIAAGRSRDGRSVLQLRTRAKVTDPFLTVLVVADWGRGRVLREFNLVIDRRVLAPQATPAPAADIPQTDAARSAPLERAEPAPRAAASPDAPSAAPPAASTPAATVSVGRGDTLLKFAREVARRDDVPVAQAAIALYEANPQAFAGSIHDLRAGVVLRLPSAEELSRLSRDRAQGEYAKQNATWRNRGGSVAAAPTNTGRLRLVAPTDVTTSTAAPTAKPAENETPFAKNSGSAEAGGKAGADSNANDERIAALERELAESTRLLEVRSREIAALQAKVSESSPPSSSVDLSAALARLWWLWTLLIGVVVGLVFELARRARSERDRELAIEPVPRGFAEAVREPTVSMPPPQVSPQVSPPPPPPPPPPATPPPAVDLQEDLEGDPPPLDETGSRLDLARAYIEMGDPAAARVELEVVLRDGDAQQRLQAQRLLETLRR